MSSSSSFWSNSDLRIMFSSFFTFTSLAADVTVSAGACDVAGACWLVSETGGIPVRGMVGVGGGKELMSGEGFCGGAGLIGRSVGAVGVPPEYSNRCGDVIGRRTAVAAAICAELVRTCSGTDVTDCFMFSSMYSGAGAIACHECGCVASAGDVMTFG